MKKATDSQTKAETFIPIVINTSSMTGKRGLSSIVRTYSYGLPDTLTGTAHFAVAYEPVNGGTTWHTHPLNLGPELCNEDVFYILRGKGVMYYKRSGEVRSLEFRQGDIIHSKHLTNYTWNTGNEPLVIPFVNVPHVPFDIDERVYENFHSMMPTAIPEEARPLDPPVLIREDDIDFIYPFPEGKAAIRPLITPKTAGSVLVNAGIFMAGPGQGSDWHSHPADGWKGFPEEDVSYVIKGRGTLYYDLDGKRYEIPIREKNIVFTGHLPHCVRNTENEELIMFCVLTPSKRAIDGHIPEICP